MPFDPFARKHHHKNQTKSSVKLKTAQIESLESLKQCIVSTEQGSLMTSFQHLFGSLRDLFDGECPVEADECRKQTAYIERVSRSFPRMNLFFR